MEHLTLKRMRILTGLITLLVMVSCLTLQLPKTLLHDEKEESLAPSKEALKQPPHSDPVEPIHLALVIHRVSVLDRALTMLKSLLYFHGQFDYNSSICSITWNTPRDLHCDSLGREAHRPLVLHLVVHRKSWRKTRALVSGWNSTGITVKMYPFKMELTLPKLKIEGSRKVQVAVQQLMLPYILDPKVDKVISLSPELLFNERVGKLWAHFDRFTPQQAIGAACEQVDNCHECCPQNHQIYPTYGLNTALRLLHLARLRKINWRKLYRMEMASDQYLDERPGDFLQGITNTILSKRIHLYYPLPCEWNVQAQKSKGLKSCPVYWIERIAFTVNCYPNSTKKQNRNAPKMALVLQYRMVKKANFTILDVQDDNDDDDERSLNVEKMDREMRRESDGKTNHEFIDPLGAITLPELRIKFHQVYKKFQLLPMRCFTMPFS